MPNPEKIRIETAIEGKSDLSDIEKLAVKIMAISKIRNNLSARIMEALAKYNEAGAIKISGSEHDIMIYNAEILKENILNMGISAKRFDELQEWVYAHIGF